mmetsp:Transcript_30352/g.67302  ORF Transcript_30352/g.67302 Transcript_30352/m.67302 type:complete len:127 (-) Transcript_30352:816-1196(-)
MGFKKMTVHRPTLLQISEQASATSRYIVATAAAAAAVVSYSHSASSHFLTGCLGIQTGMQGMHLPQICTYCTTYSAAPSPAHVGTFIRAAPIQPVTAVLRMFTCCFLVVACGSHWMLHVFEFARLP